MPKSRLFFSLEYIHACPTLTHSQIYNHNSANSDGLFRAWWWWWEGSLKYMHYNQNVPTKKLRYEGLYRVVCLL